MVGIIGPWNFPLNLVVLPASAAFAAGNRVMIKMSEVTSHTADLMAELAPTYFEPTELAVVTGGPEVAADFSRLPFDHLFFTGSPAVGSLVQRAASENLVPVTLELGGKNPVVVAPDADIRRSATRIAQARMVNGGQVCVCPDYVFVPERSVTQFVDTVRQTWQGMFATIIDNDDYCSSVNEANFDRVVGLVEDAAHARGDGAHGGPGGGDAARPRESQDRTHHRQQCRRPDGDRVGGGLRPGAVGARCTRRYRRSSSTSTRDRRRWSPTGSDPTVTGSRTFVGNTRSGGVARNDFAAH